MVDHPLQLRWADLDSLKHVNNVRYIDYALEATGRLVDGGALPGDLPIARMEVDFLHPLLLSRDPIQVRSTVGTGSIGQEIRAGDVVAARITTSFGLSVRAETVVQEAGTHLAQLRRTDLDVAGHVTTAKTFELFQEARILHFSGLMRHESAGRFVVARLAVDFVRPISWRTEPLPISSWVSKVGNSSLGMGAQIVDADGLLASCDAVLVGFDLATQRSRRFSETERTLLQSVLSAPDRSV